ncbi:light-regulated protein [Quillaja saponaria]|uniref:Light-regulated protein n=1 Tax=Quillaja saponaria TaxID=32244 RepID=A0AAD7PZ26_QUISA|nr:light-regulated protein [Quillaja saponaria]
MFSATVHCIAGISTFSCARKACHSRFVSKATITSSVTLRYSPIKASSVANDTSTVDYTSVISVFPAEACETIGGDACLADIYPEVKLEPEPRNDTARIAATEDVDRQYLEYNDSKTVFQSEACDDLGGHFCEAEYQRGVY